MHNMTAVLPAPRLSAPTRWWESLPCVRAYARARGGQLRQQRSAPRFGCFRSYPFAGRPLLGCAISAPRFECLRSYPFAGKPKHNLAPPIPTLFFYLLNFKKLGTDPGLASAASETMIDSLTSKPKKTESAFSSSGRGDSGRDPASLRFAGSRPISTGIEIFRRRSLPPERRTRNV